MKWLAGREEQADRYFEEIIEIAKDSSGDYTVDRNGEWVVDHENIQRSRLRVDALKWIASKLAPRKYGFAPDALILGEVKDQMEGGAVLFDYQPISIGRDARGGRHGLLS